MHLRAIDWSNVAGGMREQRCRECISVKRLASTETAHVTYARGCGLWHRITHYLLSHVSDPLQLKPIDIDSHLFPVPFLYWTQILELWADMVFLVQCEVWLPAVWKVLHGEQKEFPVFIFYFIWINKVVIIIIIIIMIYMGMSCRDAYQHACIHSALFYLHVSLVCHVVLSVLCCLLMSCCKQNRP